MSRGFLSLGTIRPSSHCPSKKGRTSASKSQGVGGITRTVMGWETSASTNVVSTERQLPKSETHLQRLTHDVKLNQALGVDIRLPDLSGICVPDIVFGWLMVVS